MASTNPIIPSTSAAIGETASRTGRIPSESFDLSIIHFFIGIPHPGNVLEIKEFGQKLSRCLSVTQKTPWLLSWTSGPLHASAGWYRNTG
ncbi:MAG: hypothetical protein LUE13_00045, partial [Akkermansiaceae bacterium]|nr:hypothetical protein [Akkermansiaceae bacterium]